jgi:hypothetical protein
MTSTPRSREDRSPTRDSTVAAELRRTLPGSVWAVGDPGYDRARTVWNGAVDHRPAVVAGCAHIADVQTALSSARRHGLPISVRGGGHDWAGRALREGGLVIDLSAMRSVRVDRRSSSAEVGGGALAGDLLDAAGAHGLATAAGAVRGVGIIGMAMAGGYGGLIGRFGLTLDNLLSADVVLADGTVVVAGPDGDPDLWWALRGGGGNFGVVTSARFQLHPLGPVLGGMVMYPIDQAPQVLRDYREIIATAPDELTVMAGLLTGPSGTPVVFLAPTWSGDVEAGQAAVAPLTRLGTPILTAVHPMPYPELLLLFQAGSTAGNRYALGTHWLPDLTDEAISALVEGAVTRSSPLSLLAVHQFHGAATRVGTDETAFAVRRPHLLAEVIAAWTPADGAEQHLTWLDAATSALAPGAIPGGYPNILGTADSGRARLGFASNLDRLLAAKDRYDPDNAFTAIAALSS